MLTRRQFLESGCAVAAASAAPGFIGAAGADTTFDGDDYRALVCVVLGGGADSFNMLIPTGASQFAAYANYRGELALRADAIIPLCRGDDEGRSYALHPGLGEVSDLYAAGDVAWLANAGPLRTADGRPDSAGAPDLSHADQIAHWQFGTADRRAYCGWAGRAADVLEKRRRPGRLPTNISMSGLNAMQLGAHTLAANLESNPYRRNSGLPAGVDFAYVGEQMAMRALSKGGPRHVRQQTRLLEETANTCRATVEEAVAATGSFQTPFTGDTFAADLERVARIIAARNQLEARRQIFFVHFDGWDHHHELPGSQAIMLPALSRGLAAFRDALIEEGVFEQVTTFTVSEFGRALQSNGSGADHGWGGHHIVMGGAVRGGHIYGRYPELARGASLDIGGGSFIPTTSLEDYLAEVLVWLGVNTSDLYYVLPDYGRGDSARRLGMLT